MNNENPNPRETFDKNEAGIAQTKQAIAEAVAAGDYDKVGALAQAAKSMEASNLEMSTPSQEATDDNKAFDEAKAAEKAQKDAERTEQAKQQTEKDKQEAAALLEKLTGGNAGAKGEEVSEAPKDQESLKTDMELISESMAKQKQHQGEAKFVLSENNIPAFQEAFTKLTEERIQECELRIKKLDAEWASGDFQKKFRETHGQSLSSERMKEVFDGQKETQAKHADDLRKHSLEYVQRDPNGVIARERAYDKGYEASKAQYVLIDLMNEAKKFQDLEENLKKEGSLNNYGNYTAELEGAVTVALDSRDVDVRQTLKGIARNIKKLSPELKQKIESL